MIDGSKFMSRPTWIDSVVMGVSMVDRLADGKERLVVDNVVELWELFVDRWHLLEFLSISWLDFTCISVATSPIIVEGPELTVDAFDEKDVVMMVEQDTFFWSDGDGWKEDDSDLYAVLLAAAKTASLFGADALEGDEDRGGCNDEREPPIEVEEEEERTSWVSFPGEDEEAADVCADPDDDTDAEMEATALCSMRDKSCPVSSDICNAR